MSRLHRVIWQSWVLIVGATRIPHTAQAQGALVPSFEARVGVGSKGGGSTSVMHAGVPARGVFAHLPWAHDATGAPTAAMPSA